MIETPLDLQDDPEMAPRYNLSECCQQQVCPAVNTWQMGSVGRWNLSHSHLHHQTPQTIELQHGRMIDYSWSLRIADRWPPGFLLTRTLRICNEFSAVCVGMQSMQSQQII